MVKNVDPGQTAPIGAACSGSTLFASILNSSVMLGNFLQQTTSADGIFRCIIFLGTFRVKGKMLPMYLNGDDHIQIIYLMRYIARYKVGNNGLQ